MNYVIIGCGRVGAQLAYSLFQRGHKVTIVDRDVNAFKNLPEDFLGRTIEGEASYQDVLKRAGVEQANGVAIVTSSDTLNALVGHVVHTVFMVKNVVVRNYDPLWRSTIDAFKLNVVSSSSWGAKRIEELLYDPNLLMAFESIDGDMNVYELTVPDELANRPMTDILPESECAFVGLIRNGKAILPGAGITFDPGDHILVSATQKGADDIRDRLNNSKETAK